MLAMTGFAAEPIRHFRFGKSCRFGPRTLELEMLLALVLVFRIEKSLFIALSKILTTVLGWCRKAGRIHCIVETCFSHAPTP